MQLKSLQSLFLAITFFFSSVAIAQSPGIKWQKCLGGTNSDEPGKVIASKFGDYIIAGTTLSDDFDVQGLHGTDHDGWIAKTNDTGKIIWQKSLGGYSFDFLQSAIELSNGILLLFYQVSL